MWQRLVPEGLQLHIFHLYSTTCIVLEARFVNHLYSASSQWRLRQCRLGFDHDTLRLFPLPPYARMQPIRLTCTIILLATYQCCQCLVFFYQIWGFLPSSGFFFVFGPNLGSFEKNKIKLCKRNNSDSLLISLLLSTSCLTSSFLLPIKLNFGLLGQWTMLSYSAC